MISIIALLIAILLPSLAKARNKARQSACASNCRQLSLGAVMMLQDTGALWQMNTLAATQWFGYLNTSANTFNYANGALAPYVSSSKVLVCQESMSKSFLPDVISSVQVPFEVDYGSILIAQNISFKSLSQISTLNETVIFAESQTINNLPQATVQNYGWILSIENTSKFNSIIGPHGNGFTNAAFFDGHVEALPVYVRPASAMYYAPTASALLVSQQLHIGDLPYKTPTADQIATAPKYYQAGGNTGTNGVLDWYFWLDKSAKQ